MFRCALSLFLFTGVLASDDEVCESKFDDLCLLQTHDKLATEMQEPDEQPPGADEITDPGADEITDPDEIIDTDILDIPDDEGATFDPTSMDPQEYFEHVHQGSPAAQPVAPAPTHYKEGSVPTAEELDLMKLPRKDRPLPADLMNCFAAFNSSFISLYDLDADVISQESDEGLVLNSFMDCLEQNYWKASFAFKYPAFFDLFHYEGAIAVWKWFDEMEGELPQLANSTFQEPVSMLETVEDMTQTRRSMMHQALAQPRAFWKFYAHFTERGELEVDLVDKIVGSIENPAYTIAENYFADPNMTRFAVDTMAEENALAAGINHEGDAADIMANFTEAVQNELVASGKVNESYAPEFLQSALQQLGLTTHHAIHDAFVNHTMQRLGFPKLIQERVRKMPRMKTSDF